MNQTDDRPLRFGEFTLDPGERQLIRGRQRLGLRGKPLEMLVLLARNAPRLVSRKELRAALWSNRVVEFDAAINACIRDIRQALGDDPQQPRFVETVPRHGYRFIADVDDAPVSESLGIAGRGWLPCTLIITLTAALGFVALFPSRPITHGPEEMAARAAFVKGEQLLSTHDATDAKRALPHLERAVNLRPDHAESWIALADARFRSPLRPRDTMPGAEQAVHRALSLAPDLAGAHRRRAELEFVWRWRFNAAERAYRSALELDPGDAGSHHAYGAFLMARGRSEEARVSLRRALAIDPLSLVLHGDLAWFHALAGRYDEALQECELLLELAPKNRRAIACPLRPLIALGRLDEAAAVASRLIGNEWRSGLAAADLLREYWEWRLDHYETALAAGRYVEPMAVALTHARLGDPAKAMDWVERARKERSRLFVYLLVLPEFRSLRGESRFLQAARPLNPLSVMASAQ